MTQKKRKRIQNRDNNRCFVCYSQKKLCIHHLKRQVDGGNNDDNNLITVCRKCHLPLFHSTFSEEPYYFTLMGLYYLNKFYDMEKEIKEHQGIINKKNKKNKFRLCNGCFFNFKPQAVHDKIKNI